jgi:protein-S-isoprenylcysteine O-methyltransferase Ste14
MSYLNLKIPPPAIMVLCGAFAWLLARSAPGLTFILPARITIAVILALAGISLALSGVLAFRKVQTTLNPHTPEKSSSIVQSGPYAFTRNPMYLGLVLVLLGFCTYLANPLSLLAVVVFVAYTMRFQIIPEERVLLEMFGESYEQYVKSVRRWI